MESLFPGFSKIPAAPNRKFPSTYSVTADKFFPALLVLRDELEAYSAALTAYFDRAVSSGGSAITGVSTTPLTIQTGQVSLEATPGKQWVSGQIVWIWHQVAGAGMVGRITEYVPATGNLTVEVVGVRGSGTFESWTVFVSAYAPATTDNEGVAELATMAEAVAGTDAALIPSVSALRQAYRSWRRDDSGRFPGLVPPALNLFMPDLALPGTVAFSRASTASRLKAAGFVAEEAINVPRFDYDTDGNLRGLLVENAATNVLTYSDQFDHSNWSKMRATVAANAATAPDGTLTADKLIETTDATNSHLARQSLSVTSGDIWTASASVKAGERTKCMLNFGSYVNWSGGVPAAKFDLATGEIIYIGDGASATITHIGNGWYRVSITAVATVTFSSYVNLILMNAANEDIYTGDGTSGLYVWGAQAELGACPTSYIKTTNTAATRAADVPIATLSGIDFNTSEGAIFFTGTTPPGTANFQTYFSLDNGSTSERIQVFVYGGNLVARVQSASGGIVDFTLGAAVYNTFIRVAISWVSTTAVASLNGGQPVSGVLTAIPTGLTTLRIGRGTSSATSLNGAVRHLAYFPRALTVEQLQAMTL